VAITALFNPTRKALRRFIDKRLYGIKLDYVAARKAYDGSEKAPIVQNGGTTTTFGSYSKLMLIGRGGMGEVYRAQHPTLNRSVAIKIVSALATYNPDALKRFVREAQTIARLKHPNIITLHDMGEQDGKPYMVMEYIDGKDLADILKESGKMRLAEGLPILQDIAEALDYAHDQDVIHRDIKPSNVMVEKIIATGTGKTQRAVLMDFGIAKSYAAGTNLTQSGMIGTLDYISPEQIQGAPEIDGRADIYSLGIMAYQMFTGKLPFVHNNPGAMVMAHLMQPPPNPIEVVSDLAETAAKAIMRAMAKQPMDRFSTAGNFLAALAGKEALVG
jgi:serine/threonine protein kinase